MFAAFLLWFINSDLGGKVFMIIAIPILVGAFGFASYAIGTLVLEQVKQKKEFHPIIDFIGRIVIGSFVLFSIFKIIQISGCNSSPFE